MGTLPPLIPPRPANERPAIDWDTIVGQVAGVYYGAQGILQV